MQSIKILMLAITSFFILGCTGGNTLNFKIPDIYSNEYPSFNNITPLIDNTTFGFPFGKYKLTSTTKTSAISQYQTGNAVLTTLTGTIEYKKEDKNKISFLMDLILNNGGSDIRIKCKNKTDLSLSSFIKYQGFKENNCVGTDLAEKEVTAVAAVFLMDNLLRYNKIIRSGSELSQMDLNTFDESLPNEKVRQIVKGLGVYKNKKVIVTSTQIEVQNFKQAGFTLFDQHEFYPMLQKSTSYSKKTVRNTPIIFKEEKEISWEKIN